MTLTTITLTGSFAAFNNNPASGAVLITPTSEVVNAQGQLVLAATPIPVSLSTAGTISVPGLVTTDNTGLVPPNWAYQFNVAVPGAVSTFTAYLPSSFAGSADISSLIPAPNPPSLTGPYVQSINGLSGTVTLPIPGAVYGTVSLAAGTATVSSSAVTGTSVILLTTQAVSGTPGSLYISSRASGSFTITSTSSTDTSVAGWLIA